MVEVIGNADTLHAILIVYSCIVNHPVASAINDLAACITEW